MAKKLAITIAGAERPLTVQHFEIVRSPSLVTMIEITSSDPTARFNCDPGHIQIVCGVRICA